MTLRHLATILSFMLFLVSCTKKATISDSRNDSVEKYLKLASIDTLPAEIRKSYNHKAFSFIDLEKNDSVVRWYLHKTAINSINLYDSVIFNKTSYLQYKKSFDVNDSINIARLYRIKGSYHKRITKSYDSALYYIAKAQKVYYLRNDKEILFSHYQKALLQHDFNDELGSEFTLNLILNNKFGVKESDLIYNSWNLLGNVKHNLKDYYSAIGCHSKALLLSKTNNLQNSNNIFSYEGTSLNNLGNAYRELKQYDKAVYFFNLALNDKKALAYDSELEPFLLNNIGYCYLMQNKFDKLPIFFKKAARMFDSLNIKNEAAISRIYLAEYYAKVKDTITAIQCANQALQLAKESKSSYYYLYTLSSAGTINKQKAPQYIAEYHRLNDSLLFEERKARNQYFKIQLETDEIAQQKDKAIKQKWVQTSIIASVLLIVILLFIIYKQRSQKKEFILVQNQQKANEEIYQLMLNQQSKEEEAKQKEKKRIAIELHDNVMNKLASTRFNLFSLTKKSDVQSLEQAVQHIDSIKEVEDEIRNITHELSKETFSKNNSFVSLMTQMINEQNQIHSTLYQLELDATINWDIISSEVKMNYYRIIQEAIHNCNKYALASHCTISLLYEMNQLRLTISDNGKGFEVEAAKQGIGLQNMKQRMESIEGKISINSEPGKGTLIHCFVEIEVN